jgi:hypothetical protein
MKPKSAADPAEYRDADFPYLELQKMDELFTV